MHLAPELWWHAHFCFVEEFWRDAFARIADVHMQHYYQRLTLTTKEAVWPSFRHENGWESGREIYTRPETPGTSSNICIACSPCLTSIEDYPWWKSTTTPAVTSSLRILNIPRKAQFLRRSVLILCDWLKDITTCTCTTIRKNGSCFEQPVKMDVDVNLLHGLISKQKKPTALQSRGG